MTGLLPTGATLAQPAAEPQLPIFPNSLFRVGGVATVLTFGEPLSVSPYQLGVAPGALPWFRRTFELIRADVTRPMEPVDPAPPPPEKLEPPGVVQNLRRVDTH
jgi:hypothetical protein